MILNCNFLCLSCPSATFAHQHGGFVPREWLPAKGLLRIGNSLSDWKSPRGGISQGTNLGVILFAVMTNNLLREWHLRIKFIDDTTALEILPRNGISLLNVAVNDIHKFFIEHNMELDPKKCKEMLINFTQMIILLQDQLS